MWGIPMNTIFSLSHSFEQKIFSGLKRWYASWLYFFFCCIYHIFWRTVLTLKKKPITVLKSNMVSFAKLSFVMGKGLGKLFQSVERHESELPNFLLYYCAVNLPLCSLPSERALPWYDIEYSLAAPIPFLHFQANCQNSSNPIAR